MLDEKHSDITQKKDVPIGISNLSGTSCHIGSILQLIYHGMPDIRQAIINVSNMLSLHAYLGFENEQDSNEQKQLNFKKYKKNTEFVKELGRLFQTMMKHTTLSSIENEKQDTFVQTSAAIDPKALYYTFRSENELESENNHQDSEIRIALDINNMGDAALSIRTVIQHLFNVVNYVLDIGNQADQKESFNESPLSKEEIDTWNYLKQILCEKLSGQLVKCTTGTLLSSINCQSDSDTSCDSDTESDSDTNSDNDSDAESDSDTNSDNDSDTGSDGDSNDIFHKKIKDLMYRDTVSTREFHAPLLLPVKGQNHLRSSLTKYTSPLLLKGYNWPPPPSFSSSLSPKLFEKLSYRTTQKTTFHRHHLPHYFLFQLQRFQYNPRLFCVEKVTDKIEVPYTLNVSQFSSSTGLSVDSSVIVDPPNDKEDIPREKHELSSYIYHLTGVVLHDGKTADDGHYLTLARRETSSTTCNGINAECPIQSNSDWILCDDEDIINLSPSPSDKHLSLPLSSWTYKGINSKIGSSTDTNKMKGRKIIQDHISDSSAHDMILLYARCSSFGQCFCDDASVSSSSSEYSSSTDEDSSSEEDDSDDSTTISK